LPPLIVDSPSLSLPPRKGEGRKRESKERKRICRGFPVLLFRPLIEPFRGDVYGDDRGTKKKGVYKGEFFPLCTEEVFSFLGCICF